MHGYIRKLKKFFKLKVNEFRGIQYKIRQTWGLGQGGH